MLFRSEVARELFHELPTDTQVEFARLEELLANCGKILYVEAVMRGERSLEVVVRVCQQLDSKPLRGD